MTLQEIFDYIRDHQLIAILFFLAVPLIALVTTWIGKGEGTKTPYNYVYSVLMYLAAVPGIFAVTLCVYTFLFERANFLEVNVLVYFMPIISMIVTMMILRASIDLEDVPGSGKLSGFLMTIFVVILIMYILDRTRIFAVAFIHLKFIHVLLMFVGLYIVFRIGVNRMFK